MLVPESSGARHTLADMDKAMNAVEALKQVLRHHPQSEQAVDAQFLIGQCYEHDGKFANALQIFDGLKDRYRDPALLEIRLKELRKRTAKAK